MKMLEKAQKWHFFKNGQEKEKMITWIWMAWEVSVKFGLLNYKQKKARLAREVKD